MLRLLDVMLRDLLVGELAALTSDQQVRFQPPDSTLRTDVANLNAPALDVYLVDLRENRHLRSNERTRTVTGGVSFAERVPDHVDCHYLISAWSPAQPAPGVEPTLDEHALLYETTAALMHAAPLNPARVYAANPGALAAWPARFRDEDLPTRVAPPDGFAKLAEFWSGMGSDMRWKPVVYLVVTLPVAALRDVEGPVVTTRFADYRVRDVPATAEVLLQIGGALFDASGGADAPVAGAWVAIETLAGVTVRRATTDALGRFTFERLRPGPYRLRASAVGLGTLARVVDVPSATGEYELRFP
ncbi:hypothetical protein tb265_48930 [Gemmatimonadetes bacterium T265]|nr:hypothetical protein tb265_48930 [Gemmatimonadetes bacterium T265]